MVGGSFMTGQSQWLYIGLFAMQAGLAGRVWRTVHTIEAQQKALCFARFPDIIGYKLWGDFAGGCRAALLAPVRHEVRSAQAFKRLGNCGGIASWGGHHLADRRS